MVILLSPNVSTLLSAFKKKETASDDPVRPQHIQPNVFTEDSRPKYIEDLHTEAQQGLKQLQQDENKNGVDYQDDQSVISTMTTRTDDDMSFSELRMSESESTAADTISTRSTISYQSSRSGLTRQASTFRPLKQERKHGKSRSKGRQRSTVTGIPRHVQKELGLDRAAWTASQFTDAQLTNGGVIISTVIPTLDSISITSEEGAHTRLWNAENLLAVSEDEPEFTQTDGHNNELSLIQHLLPQSLDPQRPRSLAVPWMTTSGSQPPSPVMYVSPQATYLSKIIPNAILPPSVDVVELSRNRSRSSVRMVSKSSLASASPSSTRASSRAPSRISSRAPSRISSRASSRASSRISSRASTLRSGPLSDSSGWSRSGSSETLVSDSSTISSSSTPRVISRASQEEDTDGPPMASIKENLGVQNAKVPAKPAQVNGDPTEEDSWKKSGAFNRSLSVIKKTKNPPAPPNRSYSLHPRRYGSPQNGTSNVPPKGLHPASTDSQRAMLEELEMRKNLRKAMANIHHSHTNGGSHIPKDSPASVKSVTSNGVVSSPAVEALIRLFDIPAPPGVLAPPPPPPETWAHNQRTFELLCGPGPVNFERWAQKRGLKIEPPTKKAPANIQGVVNTPSSNESTGVDKKVVSSVTEQSKFQGSPTTNRMKNSVDMQSRTATEMATDVQALHGNNLSIPRLIKVHPSPSPSPPPEHLPPLPPVIMANPPKEDISALKAQFRIPFDEIIPPPHPMFPPPPPPVNVSPPHPPSAKEETDFPPPPPPFSPKTLSNLAPLSQNVSESSTHNVSPLSQVPIPPPQAPPLAPQAPPPPPQAPPPPPQAPPPPPLAPLPTPQAPLPPQQAPLPPQQAPLTPPQVPPPPPQVPPPPPQVPPPPPQEIHSPPQGPTPPPPEASSTQIQTNVLQQVKIPQPPPLPTDMKKEAKAITADSHEKVQPPQATNPVATKEETSTPMVTQSLLQKVRLRSIKSNLSQTEVPAESPKPKQQNAVVNYEAPQKPIRRSLIMTAPPPEIASLSTADSKSGTEENQGTTPARNTQATDESKMQSYNNVEDKPHESAPLPKTAEQSSLTDQKAQHTSIESSKEPESSERVIQPPSNKAAPEPSTELTTAEPKAQPATNGIKTDINEKENSKKASETEDKPNNTLSQAKLEVILPKPQTVIISSKVSTQKLPSTSGPSSSMRLQEAIRLKTAAMSDSQVKRFSLSSPPPSAGGSSPSSTANFIFSKSTKKVVIGTPSSPEAQVDLRKTLASELASVSQISKPNDSQNKSVKVPPPIAKKPSSKGENTATNTAETETKAETEHVQTAGQQAQPNN